MKQINKKAFTLIELLVVVLIIGILAAIAVPKYQVAVAKSQYTQAITLVNSIWQAQQAYYLANNSYTDDIDKLDITLPPYESKSGTHYISYSWGNCEIASYYGTEVYCELNSYPLQYLRPYKKNNRRRCIADKNNAMAIKICENLSGGALPEEHGSFNYYLLP